MKWILVLQTMSLNLKGKYKLMIHFKLLQNISIFIFDKLIKTGNERAHSMALHQSSQIMYLALIANFKDVCIKGL